MLNREGSRGEQENLKPADLPQKINRQLRETSAKVASSFFTPEELAEYMKTINFDINAEVALGPIKKTLKGRAKVDEIETAIRDGQLNSKGVLNTTLGDVKFEANLANSPNGGMEISGEPDLGLPNPLKPFRGKINEEIKDLNSKVKKEIAKQLDPAWEVTDFRIEGGNLVFDFKSKQTSQTNTASIPVPNGPTLEPRVSSPIIPSQIDEASAQLASRASLERPLTPPPPPVRPIESHRIPIPPVTPPLPPSAPPISTKQSDADLYADLAGPGYPTPSVPDNPPVSVEQPNQDPPVRRRFNPPDLPSRPSGFDPDRIMFSRLEGSTPGDQTNPRFTRLSPERSQQNVSDDELRQQLREKYLENGNARVTDVLSKLADYRQKLGKSTLSDGEVDKFLADQNIQFESNHFGHGYARDLSMFMVHARVPKSSLDLLSKALGNGNLLKNTEEDLMDEIGYALSRSSMPVALENFVSQNEWDNLITKSGKNINDFRDIEFPNDQSYFHQTLDYLRDLRDLRERQSQSNPISSQNIPPGALGNRMAAAGVNPIEAPSSTSHRRRNLLPDMLNPMETGRGVGWLAEGVAKGLKSWVTNLNPRGRERSWYLGVLVGGGLTASTLALEVSGPGASLVRAGLIKAAEVGAIHVGIAAVDNVKWKREKRVAQKNLSGEALKLEILKIEQKRADASGKVKNFFLGMSAGATYTSLGGAGLGVAGQMINNRSFPTPDIGKGLRQLKDSLGNLIGKAKDIVTSDGTIKAGDYVPKDIKIPRGSPDWIFKLDDPNGQFATAIQAEVGKNLGAVDQIMSQSTTPMNEVEKEFAYRYLQGILEDEANKHYHKLLEEAVKTGKSVDWVAEQSNRTFEDWLQSGEGQQSLKDGIGEVIQRYDFVQSEVTKPELLAQVVPIPLDTKIADVINIGNGVLKSSSIELAQRNAINMGTHIAANYDTLWESWQRTVPHQPTELFPVTFGEIDYLVKMAEKGDLGAIARLKAAFQGEVWTSRVDFKFRLLNGNGMQRVLEILKK